MLMPCHTEEDRLFVTHTKAGQNLQKWRRAAVIRDSAISELLPVKKNEGKTPCQRMTATHLP